MKKTSHFALSLVCVLSIGSFTWGQGIDPTRTADLPSGNAVSNGVNTLGGTTNNGVTNNSGVTGALGNNGLGSGDDLGGLFGGDLSFGNLGDNNSSNSRFPSGFVGSSFQNTISSGNGYPVHVSELGGFVGSTAEAVGGPASTGGGGTGGGTRGGGGGFRGGGNGQNPNGLTINRDRQIRSRLVASFNPRPNTARQMTSRFSRRVAAMPRIRDAGSVNVSIQNGTAVLTGTVRDARQAEAIERQLRLEPGVNRIENRTKVGF